MEATSPERASTSARHELVHADDLSSRLDAILAESLEAYSRSAQQTLQRALALLSKPLPYPARDVSLPPPAIDTQRSHPEQLPTDFQDGLDLGTQSPELSQTHRATPPDARPAASQPEQLVTQRSASPPETKPLLTRPQTLPPAIDPMNPPKTHIPTSPVSHCPRRSAPDTEKQARQPSDEHTTALAGPPCFPIQRSPTQGSVGAPRARSRSPPPSPLPARSRISDHSARKPESSSYSRRRPSTSPPPQSPATSSRRHSSTSPPPSRRSSLAERRPPPTRFRTRPYEEGMFDELERALVQLSRPNGRRVSGPVRGADLIHELRGSHGLRGSRQSLLDIAQLATDLPNFIGFLERADRAGVIHLRNSQSPWGAMTLRLGGCV